jgi:hypothetical protein
MLIIKNYIIDSDKIHAQIQEQEKKSLRNKVNSDFKKLWNRLRLKKQKDKKKVNSSFIKKVQFRSFFLQKFMQKSW